MFHFRGPVWPKRLRVIHWIMTAAVVLNLFFLEEGDAAHRYWGYLACATIIYRWSWGASQLRDKAFVLFDPSMPTLVYSLIGVLILVLGLSGFLMGTDAFWGNESLENVHTISSQILMGLVGIHLVGIMLASLRERKAVWLAMFTGQRVAETGSTNSFRSSSTTSTLPRGAETQNPSQ